MPDSKRPRTTFEDVGDVTVVHFTDRRIVEASEIQILADELNQLVQDGRRKLLLNFDTVVYKSSMVLGTLTSLNGRLREMGGKLVLCGISKDIREVYRITRLDTVLAIVPDEQTGLRSF